MPSLSKLKLALTNFFPTIPMLGGDKTLTPLLTPIAIGIGGAFLLLIIRSIVFKVLATHVKRTKSWVDDAVLAVVRAPSFYWCFALAFYAAIAGSDLPVRYTRQLYQFVHVILILSLTLAAANLSTLLFKHVMDSSENASRTSGLALGIVKGVITGLGILFVMSVLGISVAPLLTALGVGGLAVALAMKDTLENLFAGIYLITDKAIRVGDYIKLETAQEGLVADIGWRTTKVSLSNYTTVIVPNSKLAQSVLTNYSVPDEKVWVSLKVPIDIASDAQKVENVLLDVAKRGSEDIVGLLTNPEPLARLSPGFVDGTLEFTVSVCIKHISDQGFILHELRKRILARFQAEKISLAARLTQINFTEFPLTALKDK